MEQRLVNSHFQSSACYWSEVYRTETVEAAIYRQRHEIVLSLIDSLQTLVGSRILELGCGAGHTSPWRSTSHSFFPVERLIRSLGSRQPVRSSSS